MGSEAVTRDIRVQVETELDPTRSNPAVGQWFYLYTVTIANEGDETVQLLNRHWIITDGAGHIEEVQGRGVVGEQPVLEPGEAFTYTSGCPLRTPFGTMRGSYEMITSTGEIFQAEIAMFELSEKEELIN